MAKPNSYVLGGNIKIRVVTLDEDEVAFNPTEARLSIQNPQGTIVTYSGAQLTDGGDYLYRLYTPTTSGYYRYEGWVKDSSGNEGMDSTGFYVSDRIIQ